MLTPTPRYSFNVVNAAAVALLGLLALSPSLSCHPRVAEAGEEHDSEPPLTTPQAAPVQSAVFKVSWLSGVDGHQLAPELGKHHATSAGAQGSSGEPPRGLDALRATPVFDFIHARREANGEIVAVLRPGGQLVHSADGAQWSVLQPDAGVESVAITSSTWWGLSEIDANGVAQRLARSFDGGKTWEMRNTGEYLEPEPVLLRAQGDGLALASGTLMLSTQDPNGRWLWSNPRVEGRITMLEPVENAGQRHWWVGTERGELRELVEGNWQAHSLPDLGTARVSGLALAKDRLFVATDRGLYVRHGNTDSAWQRVDLGPRPFEAVAVSSSGFGVAAGRAAQLAVTHDFGQTWILQDEVWRELMTGERKPSHASLERNVRFAVAEANSVLLFGDELLLARLSALD